MRLFLLTGEVQEGKTRWLEAQLAALQAAGVEAWGILTPGQWVAREGASNAGAAEPIFDKQGIDMVFYPEQTRKVFARRADLVREGDGTRGFSHDGSGRTMLWHFVPERFAEANELYARMRNLKADDACARVAVLDEVGRLELRGEGLMEGMAFLDGGPHPAFGAAVAIVRRELLEAARQRFAGTWGENLQVIGPDEDGARALLEAFQR